MTLACKDANRYVLDLTIRKTAKEHEVWQYFIKREVRFCDMER